MLLCLLGAGCTGTLATTGGSPDGSTEDAATPDAAEPDATEPAPTDAALDATGPVPDATPDAMTPVTDAGPADTPTVDPSAPELASVEWLHTDVGDWPETATLLSVTFRGSQICLDYDRAYDWSSVTIGADTQVVGNPWVFIREDDTWYAATWEWLRPGQTCKNEGSVAGDHIKQSPFDEDSGWRPESGQVLYFMVSGLARLGERNVMERTNLVRVVWP